ncbi:MAG: PASTA domain-containing protein, partial [Muribaculaceae bacterium]|nr:PASTA domain-containing protein [Muribaculaceae bacterium]
YGPAATSGQVLKNIALKMYSRGMLDNTSEIDDKAVTNTHPTLYATTRPERASTLSNDLNFSKATRMHTPPVAATGTVPDVRGLGIREALVRLEEAGLTVGLTGTRYVTAPDPPAGTQVKAGAKVPATLSQN